jgi:hypothetical protein
MGLAETHPVYLRYYEITLHPSSISIRPLELGSESKHGESQRPRPARCESVGKCKESVRDRVSRCCTLTY